MTHLFTNGISRLIAMSFMLSKVGDPDFMAMYFIAEVMFFVFGGPSRWMLPFLGPELVENQEE